VLDHGHGNLDARASGVHAARLGEDNVRALLLERSTS